MDDLCWARTAAWAIIQQSRCVFEFRGAQSLTQAYCTRSQRRLLCTGSEYHAAPRYTNSDGTNNVVS
jgi:hypothetical protein